VKYCNFREHLEEIEKEYEVWMGKAVGLKEELVECRKGFSENFESLRERIGSVLGEMNGKIDKI
jgi:hypothetical protein